MAIGDQVHAYGTANATYQPSSGVEVVLKEINGGYAGYSNHFYFYHWYVSQGIISGSSADQYHQSPGGYGSNSAAGMTDLMSNSAVPINNTHYVQAIEVGSAGWKLGGYITKE